MSNHNIHFDKGIMHVKVQNTFTDENIQELMEEYISHFNYTEPMKVFIDGTRIESPPAIPQKIVFFKYLKKLRKPVKEDRVASVVKTTANRLFMNSIFHITGRTHVKFFTNAAEALEWIDS